MFSQLQKSSNKIVPEIHHFKFAVTLPNESSCGHVETNDTKRPLKNGASFYRGVAFAGRSGAADGVRAKLSPNFDADVISNSALEQAYPKCNINKYHNQYFADSVTIMNFQLNVINKILMIIILHTKLQSYGLAV